MRTRLCIIVALAVILCGCTLIESHPDPDRTTYLAGKTAVYGLWRSGAMDIEDLRTAKPYVATLYEALGARSEAELDVTLSIVLAGWLEGLPLASDRVLVGELVDAVLADLQMADPALLESESVRVARLVIGGMLDGIALAEYGAAEP